MLGQPANKHDIKVIIDKASNISIRRLFVALSSHEQRFSEVIMRKLVDSDPLPVLTNNAQQHEIKRDKKLFPICYFFPCDFSLSFFEGRSNAFCDSRAAAKSPDE